MLDIPDAIKSLYLADKQADVRRNFRVQFPNGEMPDINADQILTESVKLDESIMSRSTFKFGLAEAPQISFETIGVPNMMGMTIACFHEIEITGLSAADLAAVQAEPGDGSVVLVADSDLGFSFYRLPLGTFIVESCPRNHGALTHRRVSASGENINADFTKLLSFETWKMGNWYAGQQAKDINVRHLVFSLLGVEVFGNYVSSAETACTATDSATIDQEGKQSTYSSYTARASVRYCQHDNAYIGSNDVMSFTMPKLRAWADIEADLQTAWDVRAAHEFSDDVRDRIFASVRGYYDNFSGLERSESSRIAYGYTEGGGVAYYPLLQSDAGRGFYLQSLRAGSATMYGLNRIELPCALRFTFIVTPQGGSSTYTHTEIDLFEGGSFPSLITYTLETGGEQSPSITAKSTAANSSNMYSFADSVDLRGILEGALEINGMFVRAGRATAYEGLTLDNSAPVSIVPWQYTEMWFDEYDVLPIGTVIYDYVDSANGEQTITYSFGSGRSIYEMTGNYLMRLIPQTLAEAQAFIDEYFVPALPGIEFTPAEVDAKGMPWIEAGDALAIETEDGEIVETYALERTLSGIQVLRDSYGANGGELIADAMGYGL